MATSKVLVTTVCLVAFLANVRANELPEDLQPGRNAGIRILRVLDSGEVVVRRTEDFGENRVIRVRLWGIKLPSDARDRNRALRWLRREFVGEAAALAVYDRRKLFVVGEITRYRSELAMVANLILLGLADTWMPDHYWFAELRRRAQEARRGIWARRKPSS